MLLKAFHRTAINLGHRIDNTFVRFAFRSRRAAGRAGRQGGGLPRLEEAAEFYSSAVADGRLFPAPVPARLTETWVRPLPRGGSVVDVTWPSRWQPLHSSYARLLMRVPETTVGHARWFRHAKPATAIIYLHGWGAGTYRLEEIAFPAAWLYNLGYDVLLATLPFHARRAPAGRWSAMFPSADPMRANEGFAQAVLDLRDLAQALRVRGTPAVGVTGMSLGGFTTALMATVEPRLEFAIPMIPFASLPHLVWEHAAGTAALKHAEDAGVDRRRFADAFAATTPLRRQPAVAPHRMLIIAAERDGVTPPKHARWLHEHFRGSNYTSFPGCHLVQVGRGDAFRALARFAREQGTGTQR